MQRSPPVTTPQTVFNLDTTMCPAILPPGSFAQSSRRQDKCSVASPCAKRLPGSSAALLRLGRPGGNVRSAPHARRRPEPRRLRQSLRRPGENARSAPRARVVCARAARPHPHRRPRVLAPVNSRARQFRARDLRSPPALFTPSVGFFLRRKCLRLRLPGVLKLDPWGVGGILSAARLSLPV